MIRKKNSPKKTLMRKRISKRSRKNPRKPSKRLKRRLSKSLRKSFKNRKLPLGVLLTSSEKLSHSISRTEMKSQRIERRLRVK